MDLIIRREVRAVARIKHRASLGACWQAESYGALGHSWKGQNQRETLCIALGAPWVGYRATPDNRSQKVLRRWPRSEPTAVSTPADSVLQSLFLLQWEMDRLLSTAICVELISWQGEQKGTNYRKMSAASSALRSRQALDHIEFFFNWLEREAPTQKNVSRLDQFIKYLTFNQS